MATKVAICLHGHIKTWSQCKASFIEKILESIYPVVPDIFVHTYDRESLTGTKYYTQSEIEALTTFELSSGTTITPKSIVIEQNDVVIPENRQVATQIDNFNDIEGTCLVLTYVKKVYLAYEQLKNYQTANSLTYDVIMMAQMDMIYVDAGLNLNEIVNERILYNYYTYDSDPCDEIVVAKPFAMNIYVDRYNQIFKVTNECLYIGAVPTNCRHLLLRYSCIKAGLGDWPWANFRTARILQ